MSVFTGVAAKIVAGAKAFKADLLKVVGEAPVVIEKIKADAPEIEALSNLVWPQAGAIEAAGVTLLEQVAGAIADTGTAVGANGLTVTFDQTVIKDVEALIPALKSFVASNK